MNYRIARLNKRKENKNSTNVLSMRQHDSLAKRECALRFVFVYFLFLFIFFGSADGCVYLVWSRRSDELFPQSCHKFHHNQTTSNYFCLVDNDRVDKHEHDV